MLPVPSHVAPLRSMTSKVVAGAPRGRRIEPLAPAITTPAGALYRAAHQAHFVDRAPAAAFAAWNAYLAEAPAGRFALEAQYNRALCLVRLGHTAAARRALRPFAAGRYGRYRQREAQALLQAIGAQKQQR